MFNEKFLDVLSHEGVVALVTCGGGEAHVCNTWNSYLTVKNGKLLLPAGGMEKTRENIVQNCNVKLTVGSKEVMGKYYMGTGFLVEGIAKVLDHGEGYDLMKEKFPWLSAVVEVTPKSVTQTM